MTLAFLLAAALLVLSLVVVAVCSMRACRILRRIADNTGRIAANTDRLHLQLGNVIKFMPKDFDLTEIWRRGGQYQNGS